MGQVPDEKCGLIGISRCTGIIGCRQQKATNATQCAPHVDDHKQPNDSRPVNNDITQLLLKWDYQPGQVAARRFKGKDGKEKIQLRVDLGILQMNAEGRPDGKRPMGFDSWFDFYRSRWEKAKSESGQEDPVYTLGAEECSRLQQETIQYHHRYICFYQLEDFDSVERDADRNLEVFDFVRAFASTEELAWSVNQFAPQLLLMRTRAVGARSLKSKRHSDAVRKIEEGITDLEKFYQEFGREDLMDASPEIQSLRHWLADVKNRKPLTELEKLQRALAEAIQIEDYEKAAQVRDRLKKIQSAKS